jgi:hypothetical protein
MLIQYLIELNVDLKVDDYCAPTTVPLSHRSTMYPPLLLIPLHLKHVIANIKNDIFLQHQSKWPASTISVGNDSNGDLGTDLQRH